MPSMLQKEGEYVIYWDLPGIFHLSTCCVQCDSSEVQDAVPWQTWSYARQASERDSRTHARGASEHWGMSPNNFLTHSLENHYFTHLFSTERSLSTGCQGDLYRLWGAAMCLGNTRTQGWKGDQGYVAEAPTSARHWAIHVLGKTVWRIICWRATGVTAPQPVAEDQAHACDMHRELEVINSISSWCIFASWCKLL